jgi:ankyrin repeat protein
MDDLRNIVRNSDVQAFISKHNLWSNYDELSILKLAIEAIDYDNIDIFDTILIKFPNIINQVFVVTDSVNEEKNYNLNQEHTLLSYAITKSFSTYDFIKVIMNYNPDLKIKLNGDSILHIAIKNNKHDLIPLLLDKQMDIKDKDSQGKTVSQLICNSNNHKLLNYFSLPVGNASTSFELLYNKILSIKNNNKDKPFYIVRYGSLNEINDMFSNEDVLKNVNIVDDHGNCLLMYGVLRDVNVLNILLKYGCEVNNPNKDNITPLMFAIYRGKPLEVEFLLNNGAKDTYISRDGINFNYLISHSDIDVIKLYANKYSCIT